MSVNSVSSAAPVMIRPFVTFQNKVPEAVLCAAGKINPVCESCDCHFPRVNNLYISATLTPRLKFPASSSQLAIAECAQLIELHIFPSEGFLRGSCSSSEVSRQNDERKEKMRLARKPV